MTWETLGTVPLARLLDARLQLHWAAQPAAAVGKLLLPHQADFGEQSFRWSHGARCLAQGLVTGPTSCRAALRPAPPALLLLAADDQVLRELPLAGRTLGEAYDWLGTQLGQLLERPLPGELERPAGLPAHALATGGRFDGADAEAFAELRRLFANADRVLTTWSATAPGAAAVRCWPHHFDLATLAPAGPLATAPPPELADMMPEVPEIPESPKNQREMDTAGADPEAQCTLGVGLVPGDESRPEPYFYVTPWPYPENPELPPLAAGGIWHTAGWLGAVLAAPRFMDRQPAPVQAAVVEEFLASATMACRRLLERRGEARR
jgi:hypothetical protein